MACGGEVERIIDSRERGLETRSLALYHTLGLSALQTNFERANDFSAGFTRF